MYVSRVDTPPLMALSQLHGQSACSNRSKACCAAAQSVVNNLRNPVSWIPFTKPWREHRGNIRRVLAVMRNLLQEVHDRYGRTDSLEQLSTSRRM